MKFNEGRVEDGSYILKSVNDEQSQVVFGEDILNEKGKAYGDHREA